MDNRDIEEVATANLKALWDQETERQTIHNPVAREAWGLTEQGLCIKCGLPVDDPIHSDLSSAVDGAVGAMSSMAKENMRLRHLLTVVANMGLDPEDGVTEEWTFCEDAAQFVKDNL